MIVRNNYYINGVGVISPQKTFDNSGFLPEVAEYNNNILPCVVPDFKQYIAPNQVRRLSRMLRIGLSAAMICVQDSGNTSPDGVITATGYGLLNDTEKFLLEILLQDEKYLTPTFFMQSTYNALAGLVGLSLKCLGYNNTFVSKGFAFEMALHDAMMQLNEKKANTFLIGAYDEVNEVQYLVNSKVGHYKEAMINNLTLFQHGTNGSLQGEGAAFFSLSANSNQQTWCSIKGIKMVFMPECEENLVEGLLDFLEIHNIATTDVDVFMSGVSGDVINDRFLESLAIKQFRETHQVRFKHLCGEYCTASSFGLWLGASIIKKQQIPPTVKFNQSEKPLPLKTLLLVNQYMGRNYSFFLLQQV